MRLVVTGVNFMCIGKMPPGRDRIDARDAVGNKRVNMLFFL